MAPKRQQMITTTLSVLIIIAGPASKAFSQQKGVGPQQASPTFKLQVQRNLVPVRVVVRDSKGRAVGGLRKEDFKLFDNGKLQAITHFSEETPSTLAATETKATPPETQPSAASAAKPTPVAPLRYVTLFFDDVFLRFADFAHGRDAADRFVTTALTPSDRVGIFTSSDLHTLGYTDDRAKLHQAISRLRPVYPAGDYPPFVGYDVITNFEHLIRRMATLPGERHLILISDGFCPSRGLGYLLLQSLLGEAADRALRTNVIISALEPQGLPILMPELDASWEPEPGQGGGAQIGALHMEASFLDFAAAGMLAQLADATGGELFHNNNDLDAGFAQVAAAPDVYYTLAFSPQNLKYDGSFHRLRVELVNNSRLTVVARRGYLEPKKFPGNMGQVSEEIEAASFSLDELKELSLDARTQYSENANGEAQISVDFHVDTGSLRYRNEQGKNANELLFLAVLFDRDGNYLDSKWKRLSLRVGNSTLGRLRASGIEQELFFEVKPGTYLIREVVQDSVDGHLAALNSRAEVPF